MDSLPAGSRATPSDPDPDDLACYGCGYLLRGLPREGQCPECGLLIAHSISEARLRAERARQRTLSRPPPRRDPLADAPRWWLRTMASAAVLLILTWLGAAAWFAARLVRPFPSLLPDYLMMGLAVLYALSLLVLGCPEPKSPRHPRPQWRWQLVRLTLWAGGAGSVVAAVWNLISEQVPWFEHPPYHQLSVRFAYWSFVPSSSLMLLYLAYLAERLRAPKAFLGWGIALGTWILGHHLAGFRISPPTEFLLWRWSNSLNAWINAGGWVPVIAAALWFSLGLTLLTHLVRSLIRLLREAAPGDGATPH